MTMHYHGLPLSPRIELEKLRGKCFCVSYADARDADWCMVNAQSVMWDNGAFTAFRQGKEFDPQAFAAWVSPRLGPLHWAVIPDVIDGTEEQQRDRLKAWPHPKEFSAPVWHMGLSIDWLVELASTHPRICFGSSERYWQVGSPIWARRADEAFNALERRGLRLWVHMLRGLDLCGDKWPFTSADSVNVARNFKNAPTCPERLARVIDGRQCPIRWHMAAEQLDMLEACNA